MRSTAAYESAPLTAGSELQIWLPVRSRPTWTELTAPVGTNPRSRVGRDPMSSLRRRVRHPLSLQRRGNTTSEPSNLRRRMSFTALFGGVVPPRSCRSVSGPAVGGLREGNQASPRSGHWLALLAWIAARDPHGEVARILGGDLPLTKTGPAACHRDRAPKGSGRPIRRSVALT